MESSKNCPLFFNHQLEKFLSRADLNKVIANFFNVNMYIPLCNLEISLMDALVFLEIYFLKKGKVV